MTKETLPTHEECKDVIGRLIKMAMRGSWADIANADTILNEFFKIRLSAENLAFDNRQKELTQAVLLAGTRVAADPSDVHINNLKQTLLELGQHLISVEVPKEQMQAIEKEATNIQHMELEGKRNQALLELAEAVIHEKNWKPSDVLDGIQQSDLSDKVREKLRRIEELRTMKINT